MSDSPEVPEFSPRESQLVYVAVAEHVVARVQAGDLRPGARLPSERDLAAEYGVAYMTVRRAMARLREEGWVESVHGKGTFISDPVPEQPED